MYRGLPRKFYRLRIHFGKDFEVKVFQNPLSSVNFFFLVIYAPRITMKLKNEYKKTEVLILE